MKNKYTLVKYHTRTGWRWKLTHKNGKIVANGGQGYQRQVDMNRSIANLFCALGAPGRFDVVVKKPKGRSYRG